MRWRNSIPWESAVFMLVAVASVHAGPYSGALDDPTNDFDAPVPGFVGPNGMGKPRILTGFDDEGNPLVENPDNFVNPLFFAWAEEAVNYVASETVQADFADPIYALGPVTGDNWDVVSLGEMSLAQILNEDPPGTITLRLARPVRDLAGADFVVFENAIIAASQNVDNAVIGQIFGELAYVEVSADGENFTRFPASSLTPAVVGAYGSIDATNVRNLAGKHANAGGECWGTPFDLADVNMDEIQYVRIVDIPGNGAFTDSEGRPIYDPWKTFGSGGFDLEAVGAISTTMTYDEWPQLEALPTDQRGDNDDPDRDGIVNLLEYAFARLPWMNDGPVNQSMMVGMDGQRALSFVRDERLGDLRYEVQAAVSLTGDGWTAIAASEGGGPVQALPGHGLVIAEESASEIASMGVIRRVSVRESSPPGPSGRRFYRLKISRLNSP